MARGPLRSRCENSRTWPRNCASPWLVSRSPERRAPIVSMQSSAPVHTAANAPATEDLGPLAWVLGEIHKSLDGVAKTLRRFARDAAAAAPGSEIDTMPARLARQQLHQAVGALQMVGHTAPALVLGAMEFAVQSFITEPLRCTESAVQKIEKAGFAV